MRRGESLCIVLCLLVVAGCATTPAERALRDGSTLGTVMVNLQRTPLDGECAVRVWARLDATRKVALRVGKRADLVVLDQNLLEIDPSKIHETNALLTILGGRVVYEREVALIGVRIDVTHP